MYHHLAPLNFQMDPVNAIILFVMIANTICGLFVYLHNKNGTNFYFLVLTSTISMWGASMFLYRGFQDHSQILLMTRFLYFSATLIPISFLYFVFSFPSTKEKRLGGKKCLLFIAPFLLSVAALTPGWFVKNVYLTTGEETVILFNNGTHVLFSLYVILYFIYAYMLLYRKSKGAEPRLKKQLFFISIATAFSASITLITNLYFPIIGIFAYNWVGQSGIILMITVIFYSILRHDLFNTRIIAIELALMCLWSFLLMRIFYTESTRDLIIESSVSIILIILGILLIQNALQTIKQRNEINELAKNLGNAYARLDNQLPNS